MPVLLQICVVTMTVSLLVIGVMTFRLMDRINRSAEDISSAALAIRESAARIDRVSQEAHTLAISLQSCVPPVQRVVDRFAAVGQRASDLSSALIESLEPPVFTASALAIGVRAGATHLLQRLTNRFSHRNTSNNGDHDHA